MVTRPLRHAVASVTVAAVSLASAWAAVSLAPTGREDVALNESDLHRAVAGLDTGHLVAGAARIDLRPRPDDFGGTWQTEGCATFGADAGLDTVTHALNVDQSRWPEAPDCLYMGGYGIGPMNPITDWDDEAGLHVRAVAFGDGHETVVLVLLDAIYYLGRYGEMCDDCGALDIAERVGADLGIDPAGVFVAATHSHTSPDLIGGWGGVPDWYLRQVSSSIEAAIHQAVADARPAVLEVGEVCAREFNRERRNTYRSAEDPGLTWLRAVAVDEDRPRGGKGRPSTDPPEVIATVAAYAAHPVTRDADTGVAHGDWPAVFAAAVEARDGGVAMAMATGLGNLSPRHLHDHGGADLAARLPAFGDGEVLTDTGIAVAAHRWTHPVTNPALTALALPGFFDRPFDAGPATVDVGTHEAKRCHSSSPVGVTTQVNAAAIGPLVITGAPGETFSNLSNTIKEHNPGGVTMPLALVNDGLGYVVQSFEGDDPARSGAGFVGDPVGLEYEDAYAIDRCFGDMILEQTIGLVADVTR
ncbi:MAG: hypothetical protein KG028_09305 [Actinobacteria bacterium]|jgi:hypothetical protein|nr:hypothetical protein [Actinomycetota bacterium]